MWKQYTSFIRMHFITELFNAKMHKPYETREYSINIFYQNILSIYYINIFYTYIKYILHANALKKRLCNLKDKRTDEMLCIK